MAISQDSPTIPTHVAIIMDGNGRYAKRRGLPRIRGHREGLEVAKKIVKAAVKKGIKYVTLYTFSTENWKRTQEEVGYLMSLIKTHLRKEFDFYRENKIHIEHIGDLEHLPPDVKLEILNAKADTQSFNGMTVVLAINYGARDEIMRAVKKIQEQNLPITCEADIKKALDLPALPDVDLLIRTGGEERISNFLLWQCAYAEFVFTNTLWPDYTEEEFYKHLEEFSKRTRKFGSVVESEQ